MTIKNKISLTVILSITITTICALFITITISRNTFEEQFHSQADFAIKASKGGIQSALNRAYETSLSLVDSPFTLEWLQNEGEAGNEKIQKLMTDTLQSIMDVRGYNVAFIANKKLNHYYIGNKLTSVLSPDNPENAWFYLTLRSGRKVFPRIENNMLWVNALSIVNGEAIGVAGVGLNIQEFVAKFKKSIPTSNSVLFLADEEEKILVSSNDKHLGEEVYKLVPDSEVAKRHLASGSSYEYQDDTHGKTLLVKSPISDTGLSIYLVAPQSDFVPGFIDLGGFSFALVVVLTVVSIFCVMYILTVVFRKIHNIVAVANAIAKGDLSVDVEADSDDEVGELAGAMHQMMASLKVKAGVIDRMAQGDFSVKVDLASEKDELGNSLQIMLRNLNDLLHQIIGGSSELGVSSEELSAISNQISSATTEMTSQAVAVSGASNQMTSNIATNASSMEEMSANIQSISATTTEMSQSMSEVTQTMENLSDSIRTVSEKSSNATTITDQAKQMSTSATVMMSDLTISAHKIGEITEVIKEIAQQTNLLALNANIEAASAGEAGKGFAVVANEIKELAQQSSTSAESISATVKDIQEKTSASETSINEISTIISDITQSSDEVKTISFEGAESVNDVLQNIKESAVGINEIAKMINEISVVAQESARTSGELRNGSDEITKNMSELNLVVKDTSAGIEKVSDQARTLFKMADQQRKMVGKFNLTNK